MAILPPVVAIINLRDDMSFLPFIARLGAVSALVAIALPRIGLRARWIRSVNLSVVSLVLTGLATGGQMELLVALLLVVLLNAGVRQRWAEQE